MKAKMFIPEDIVSTDDSRHKKFSNIESWYFDAVLDNNFSIVAQINVLNIGRAGTVLTGMHIYKNAELFKSIRQKHKYRNFWSSEKKPDVKIKDVNILETHIEKNKWQYNINMQEEQTGFNVKFTNTVKGWKMKTFAGLWLVIPRLSVSGELILDGKKIEVKGRGYHDHNVFPIYTPFKIKGWHFGTVSADSDVLTWARVIKNRRLEKIVAVYNTEDSFVKIPSEDIEFKVEVEQEEKKKNIPKIFSIKINNKRIVADVRCEAIDIHHINMPTLNYWRYHLKTSGKIETGNKTKKIDSIEISENMHFL